MKNVKPFLIPLGIIVASFLVWGFTLMEWDPSLWPEDKRSLFVGTTGFLVASYYFNIDS